MNSSIEKRSLDRAIIITSIPAGLIWFGVLIFLAKWFHFWAGGRLEPGQGTSWFALILLFSLALFACAGGIYSGVRAWGGKSRLRWQIVSLIGAVLALWAVSGD